MTRTLIALAATILSTTPASAQIVRHTSGPGPSMILQGVTIPPGAETLILSGQLPSPIEPARQPDSIDSYGDTKTQTISTFNKIEAILKSRGYAMSDVVKMTVFLTADPKRPDGKMDFAGMNEGFRMFFGTVANPNTVARSTVQVAALAGPYFLVEIEVTAARMPAR